MKGETSPNHSRTEPLNRSAAFTPRQCGKFLHYRKLKRRERRAPPLGSWGLTASAHLSGSTPALRRVAGSERYAQELIVSVSGDL